LAIFSDPWCPPLPSAARLARWSPAGPPWMKPTDRFNISLTKYGFSNGVNINVISMLMEFYREKIMDVWQVFFSIQTYIYILCMISPAKSRISPCYTWNSTAFSTGIIWLSHRRYWTVLVIYGSSSPLGGWTIKQHMRRWNKQKPGFVLLSNILTFL
jgi:hypothetical protein